MRSCVIQSENNDIRKYSRPAAASNTEDMRLPNVAVVIERLDMQKYKEDNQIDSSSEYDSSDDEVMLDINNVAKDALTFSNEPSDDSVSEQDDSDVEDSNADGASSNDTDTDDSFEDPADFRLNKFGRNVGSSSVKKSRHWKH